MVLERCCLLFNCGETEYSERSIIDATMMLESWIVFAAPSMRHGDIGRDIGGPPDL
jgi:hypothetical protein